MYISNVLDLISKNQLTDLERDTFQVPPSLKVHIPAIYLRNFKPKFFIDIKTPVKQFYSPNTGICYRYKLTSC